MLQRYDAFISKKGFLVKSVYENLFFMYKGDGYYADRTTGCQQYYVCVFTGTVYQQIHYHICPPGTLFDERSGSCNYANQVTC